MVSPARWNVSAATLFQLVAEVFWVVVAVLLAIQWRGIPVLPLPNTLAPALVFAILMVLILSSFGMYKRDRKIGLAVYAFRLLLAMLICVPLAYVVANFIPGAGPFQETVSDWVLLAFAGLIVVRQLVTGPVLKLLLPHRVLVLGTGPEARLVEASLASAHPPGLKLVGFFALEKVHEAVVSPGQVIVAGAPLADAVRELRINEIIVAVRQQRGGVLPLRALLDCRLAGVAHHRPCRASSSACTARCRSTR